MNIYMRFPRKVVKNFRWLRYINKAHGPKTRHAFAGGAYVLTCLFGQGMELASQTAAHFRADRFAIGFHLLSWHLHNGWTGRFFQRTPRFNFTTALNDKGRQIVERKIRANIAKDRTKGWRHSYNRDRHALLYLIGQRVHQAPDAATRHAAAIAYGDLATWICQTIMTSTPDLNPEPKSNRFSLQDARTTLLALRDLCDPMGLPWYLVSGTFLGAVREGDFLSHDYDIDIGINIEDFDEDRFLTALEASDDLTLVNINPYIHMVENADGTATHDIRPALYRVMHRSGIEVDVFIHHLDDGQRWHGSSKHTWTNSDFTLGDYEISGIKVKGPADADRYLTENYGNWRVPVTVFNCSTGTPNVAFNNNLISIAQTLRTAGVPKRSSVAAETARLVLRQAGYLSLHDKPVEDGAVVDPETPPQYWQFQVPWISASSTDKSANT